MNSPFPGMNPYLEQPELWHQAHNRLTVGNRVNELTPHIFSAYIGIVTNLS
ncbi:MAG: DUF4058 family protein [Cyanobacteria bacterium J06633_8]